MKRDDQIQQDVIDELKWQPFLNSFETKTQIYRPQLVFNIPDGKILATYDKDGKLLRTAVKTNTYRNAMDIAETLGMEHVAAVFSQLEENEKEIGCLLGHLTKYEILHQNWEEQYNV